MAELITLTANWTTGKVSSGMISRQYDNNRYCIKFTGIPDDGGENLIYYLLIYMKTEEGAAPVIMAPVQLASDEWIISNYFTQIVQQVKFQLCVQNEAGTFEAHSPIFDGSIRDSLDHDGEDIDIDTSELFDYYRAYVEERVNDLIVAAGNVQIDTSLSVSGAAAEAAAVGAALSSTNERLSGLDGDYVPMPKDGGVVDYGEAGYVLMTNGDGTTEWVEMSGGEVVKYSITNNLTNVTTSNGTSSVRENRPYSATLTLAEGAVLDTVTVTMNGTDITATAWNASTMAISIASVTGDVVITASASIVITQAITWTGSGADKSSQIIDATNANVYYEVTYNDGDSRFVSGVTAESVFSKVRDVALYSDAEGTNLVGYYRRDSGEIKESIRTAYNSPAFYYNTKVLVAPAGYYIRMMVTRSNPSFETNDSFGSYLSEYGAVVTLETPEPEPEEEISNAEATDNDLLQMYSLNAVSLSTDIVEDTTSYAGIIEAAKNEWMLEYGGNVNKIPLIIHTDQHDDMGDAASKTMWETIDNMVSWFDISKVINLGDTTNSYDNYSNPDLGDTNLEAYLEATKAIPFSKRIEVFGNHDCMSIINGSLTYVPQAPNYLNPYFKNVMARRTSSNGNWCVTYDPYFNVKYIIYSAYDWLETLNDNGVTTEQYDFLIEEMSKNDGYDIILLGHTNVAIWQGYTGQLAKARFEKTSGSFTDRLGASHTYDFTDCENDLLVCFHGHDHSDGYDYNQTVLSQGFDNYYETFRPIFFVIVDRENAQIKVWKVMNTPEYTVYTRPFIETT